MNVKSGRRWTDVIGVRNLLVLWLMLLSAVAFLDRTNISIAGVEIGREFGVDDVHLGWIFSAFLAGYTVFQIAGGWLAVRIGPRRVLTAGVCWWGVFTALTALVPPGFAHSLALLIAVRFALGAGEAVVYPASNQFVARWIPAAERGRANGAIFSGVGVGAGLTPVLLTAIIAHFGWPPAQSGIFWPPTRRTSTHWFPQPSMNTFTMDSKKLRETGRARTNLCRGAVCLPAAAFWRLLSAIFRSAMWRGSSSVGSLSIWPGCGGWICA
jgi:MFS family permease